VNTIVLTLGIFSVLFSNTPGTPRDFAALYSDSAPNNQYMSWVYLACNAQNCRTSTATSGLVSFTFPKIDGDYEIRFLNVDANNNYNIIPGSPKVTFTLTTCP